MKTVSLAVARRYARALLEVAPQEGSAEKLRDEIRSAVALLSEHKDLAAALTHPALPHERKARVTEAIWTSARASAVFRRLMALLVEHDRVDLLPAIEAAFTAQWNDQRRVATAEIVSATELEAGQTSAITAVFERITSRRVEAKSSLDPALLGGVLVRIGGRSYDGTVSGRLRGLRERLAKGA
jgi:F-type H+-transporting ATPase subunit delta